MDKCTINPESVVNLLNDALQCDNEAIQKLFSVRVSCNKTLQEHPTIQVRGYEPDKHTVSFLGILNGLFPVKENGYGHLCCHVNDSGIIEKFDLTK